MKCRPPGKELQDLGITSVPLFIIDNRSAISGAQSIDTFVKAFEEVAMVADGDSPLTSEGLHA